MPRGNPSVTRHRRPWKVENGQYPVSVTATAGSTNSWATTAQVGWTRITSDGTTVTVKCIGKASSDPAPSDSDWSTQAAALTSTNFDCSEGGTIGFESNHDSPALIDDITLKSDTDANGSYETTELVETFTADGSGYMEDTLAHDAAGNLTFDGLYRYTYDAWNRLVKVNRGYRDSGGTLQTGSVVQENEYDGRGFRIVHRVKNSGVLDATYHDYYTPGWQNIETRNGSGQVIKQHVWGLTYIDELVQIAVNGEPVDDPDFDPEDTDHDPRLYWAMQDANFNVLGIVDDAGALAERYEYTPYGERTVFTSPGANDPSAVPGSLHTPSQAAPRVTISSVRQPYGICDIGCRGLKHQEELGGDAIYNRARQLKYGKYIQRDPARYIDGMSLYSAYQFMHYLNDYTGMYTYDYHGNWTPAEKAQVEESFKRVQQRVNELLSSIDDKINNATCEPYKKALQGMKDTLVKIKAGLDSQVELELHQKAMVKADGSPDMDTIAKAEWIPQKDKSGWFFEDADDMHFNTNANWSTKLPADLDMTILHEVSHIAADTADGSSIPGDDAYNFEELMKKDVDELGQVKGAKKKCDPEPEDDCP